MFEDEGTLSHLFVAFSRLESDKKVYVQHLMKENSAMLAQLILYENAHVFVCGDASRMAKDVENTIQEIVALHSKMGLSESAKFIAKLKGESRYCIDVWSS